MTDKLFRAENNLNLHTVLRTNYGNIKGKGGNAMVDEETAQLLINEVMSHTSKNTFRKQRSNVRNFRKTRSSLVNDQSHTNLSEKRRDGSNNQQDE